MKSASLHQEQLTVLVVEFCVTIIVLMFLMKTNTKPARNCKFEAPTEMFNSLK